MAEDLHPYWMALGKFVHRYALIEAALFQVFRISAGLPTNKTKAVFSGLRVRDAVSGIKRIHEATGEEISPWLERAFSRILEVTNIRDRILHDGFELEDNRIIVSNLHKTLPRAAQRNSYTIEDLDALEADCLTIVACLNVHWIEAKMPRKLADMLPREREMAQAPWRYKARSNRKSHIRS